MNRCTVTLGELIDYSEGRMDALAGDRLRAHIDSGCPSCGEELALLSRLHSSLSDAISPSEVTISESTRSYVRALARMRATPSVQPTALPVIPSLRRWIARLTMDDTHEAVGVRGPGNSTQPRPYEVQRLYATEDHLITLWEERRLSPSHDSYIIGQIYSRQDNVCVIPNAVIFIAASGETHAAHQEGGEFHVPNLGQGKYLVQCWLPEGEISLHKVQIGEEYAE